MCGRFTLRASPKEIADLFSIEVQLELLPRFNIAPTQNVLAIRASSDDSLSTFRREAVQLRWGLVPGWAEDPSIGNSLINARSETIASKPAFRKSFAKRRCLIAADGFYEWQKSPDVKQPFYITREDSRPFAFAGLHDRWHHGDLVIESCTIITTEANELLKPLHNRMPVILSEHNFSTWLNPTVTETAHLQSLLRSSAVDELKLTPVSTLVNRPGNDGPECIEAIVADIKPVAPGSKSLSRPLFEMED